VSVDAVTAVRLQREPVPTFTAISPASQVVAWDPTRQHEFLGAAGQQGHRRPGVGSSRLGGPVRALPEESAEAGTDWKRRFRLHGGAIAGVRPADRDARHRHSLPVQTGTEIKEAMAIPADGGNDPIVTLRRSCSRRSSTVSGNTLIGEEDLHEVLIIYGEELFTQRRHRCPDRSYPWRFLPPARARRPRHVRTMNGSTGGGGTED
jgi:hypothetical protein